MNPTQTTNLAELEEVFCLVMHNGGTLQEAIACVLRANSDPVTSIYDTPAGRVLRAACHHYEIRIGDLLNPCREERFTRRRYASMVAMRLAGVRLLAIAAALGYLDHSVVLHGLNKAKRRPDIASDGERIHAKAFALGVDRAVA